MADRATWERRVGAWRASGQTAARFCEGREFAAATLHWWSSELGQRTATNRPAASQAPRLARVVRVNAAAGVTAGPGPIVVEIAGARVVVVPGFDRATLGAVVDVLAARGGGGTR
jgi:hypothetical protein